MGPTFDRDSWVQLKERPSVRASGRGRDRKGNKLEMASPVIAETSSSSGGSLRHSGDPGQQSAIIHRSQDTRPQELNDLVQDLERGLKRMTIGPAEHRYTGKVLMSYQTHSETN